MENKEEYVYKDEFIVKADKCNLKVTMSFNEMSQDGIRLMAKAIIEINNSKKSSI